MPIVSDLNYFLYNEDAASQPPVLLIHGAGGDCLHWPPQIRRLSYGRIYAVDLPGHGESGLLGCQRVEDYVQALIYFMNDLDLYSAVVVGHSMGGAIALQMALDYPERVLGLGLLATGAHLPVSQSLLDMLSCDKTLHAGVDLIIQWAFSPSADANLRKLAQRRMQAVRPAVLHGDFVACNAWDVRTRLSEIRAPALILAGSADKMTPLRFSEYLHQELPHSELKILPDAGHMLMLERPLETAQALSEWLQAIPYVLGQ